MPWPDSPAVNVWLKTLDGKCPDDLSIPCASIGDIQPYFTRRLVAIIENIRPGSSVIGWNPGIGALYRKAQMSDRHPNFTFSNWYGWGNQADWPGPMSHMTNINTENATAILNFSGGDKSSVRGAEIVAWGDAATIDSGNAVTTMAKYLAAVSLQLWSPNGTVPLCQEDACPTTGR